MVAAACARGLIHRAMHWAPAPNYKAPGSSRSRFLRANAEVRLYMCVRIVATTAAPVSGSAAPEWGRWHWRGVAKCPAPQRGTKRAATAAAASSWGPGLNSACTRRALARTAGAPFGVGAGRGGVRSCAGAYASGAHAVGMIGHSAAHVGSPCFY